MPDDLHPIPFETLVDRLDREFGRGDRLFTIHRRDWWTPNPSRDVSLLHHGHRLGTPAGPASGPHSQLAQNLLMAWLVGGRFMELKTVQVRDDLDIPRPCIQVPHVGYNVEWSQELRVSQSAREYVAAWMLVHMAADARGTTPDTVFDVSLGYDLEGVRTDKVRDFLDLLRDAGPLQEALRAELPPHRARWAAVAVPARVSDTVTLSTFHGCPAGEIEAIANQTLDWGWHTTVKLNPTLLGHDRCRQLLDGLGYGFIQLKRDDFDRDLQWSALMEMVPRLYARARSLGLAFGVKFSNTLVCRSPEAAFAPSREIYLSGPPLHALAFTLAAEFRAATTRRLGVEIPITFSAGIDATNFATSVAAGLGPVTACSDLLKGKGYARMTGYLRGLEREMSRLGARDLPSLRRAFAEERGVHDARDVLPSLATEVAGDPRYARGANQVPPRKVGSELVLLDCLTCDKCIPVCPNAANFTVPVTPGKYRPGRLRWLGAAFDLTEGELLVVARRHQIGNVADACNQCGQCDTWCPEDGGPYLVKANIFLGEASFSDHPDRDGFLVDPDRLGMRWRREGTVWRYRRQADGTAVLRNERGSVLLRDDTPLATEGEGELDLTVVTTLRLFLDGFATESTEAWLPPSVPI